MAEWLYQYFDPTEFVAAESAEALMKMTGLRTDENIGAGLLVQRHLYNRPLPPHALQDAEVLFRGERKAPLFTEMNPEAAPLFSLTLEGKLTEKALKDA